MLLKKSPNNEYLNMKYNTLSEQIIKKRLLLRANFNSNKINRYANNPKLFWKNVNEILSNKERESNYIKAIEIGHGNVTTSPIDVANCFNIYFANVGKSLHDLIMPNIITFRYIEIPSVTQSIYLWNVSNGDIIQKIMSLKNGSQTKDGISSDLLKENAHKIAPILKKYINESLENGIFPKELKCSRIVPIYKDGDPLQTSNYRPISLLPKFSQIYESIIFDRIYDYFIKKNIINSNQYGFQKQSGTLSAAATLIDYIQTNLDTKKNNLICCTFIDLRKAFDTIPHDRLINKLYT